MNPQIQNTEFIPPVSPAFGSATQLPEKKPRRPYLIAGLIGLVIVVIVSAIACAVLKHTADTAVATYKQQLAAFSKQSDAASKKALAAVDATKLTQEVQDAKNDGVAHDELLALARKQAAILYQADYDAQSVSSTQLPKLKSVFLGNALSKDYREAAKRQQAIQTLFAKYLKLERYTVYGLRFADLAAILQADFVDEIETAQQVGKVGGLIQEIVDPTASSKDSATRESLVASYDLDLREHAQFKKSLQNFPLLKEYESIRTKALVSEEKMVASQKRLVAAYRKGDASAYQNELKVYNKDTKYAYVTTFVDDVTDMAHEVAKIGNKEKPVDLMPKLTSLIKYE